MTSGSQRRAALRKEAQALDATMQVGKDGLTPGVAAELVRQLKAQPVVKVRMLRTSGAVEGGAQAMAETLAAQAGADLVEVRGHTAVYARRRAAT